MALVNILGFLTLSLLSYSPEDLNAYELFSIGTQLEFEGKAEEAIEYYKNAHAMAPHSTEISISLAGALYSVQRFDEGISYARAALVAEPQNVRLHQIAALGYLGKRDLPEAIKYYEKTLELAPRNMELYLASASLYEASRKIAEAISILERMPLDIRTPEIYIKLAALAGRMNDHMSAIEYARQGYALDTTSAAALISIATGFDMLGVQDSAIYYYERAHVEMDTFNLNLALRLVDLYTDADRYEQVLITAEQILNVAPLNGHVRRSLGFAHYKLGKPLAALNEFYIALRQDPSDTYSAFYLARIYLEQDEYDRARREIDSALRINPEFIELWIYLGFAAIEKGDYELAGHAFTEAAYRGADLAQVYYLLGAIKESQAANVDAYFFYKKALTIEPGSISALQALAGLASRIGRDDEAFQTFERIVEIDTVNAVALNYVGYTYAERNERLGYALALIDRALGIEPDNGYYLDSRGWVLYRMGRYEEALQDLKRAGEFAEDPVILEHLGDVHLELGDREAARAAYERALELDPGNAGLKHKRDSVP
ncbi:tetratricopeptide repeat protein [candidate division WOR-3 bacterium]|nr:tetratricopeptide repeat protein [candidate division WOR-3 bacterium]